MDGNEFRTIVQEEIKKVESVLRTHVSDEVAKKYTETEKTFAELREELNKKMEADPNNPGAQAVKDMEKRLISAEEVLRDLVAKAESIAMRVAADPKNQAERDVVLFKGIFLKNAEEFQAKIRAFRTGFYEQGIRAIDSSLFTTGGQLSAETADRFLDFVTDQTVALKRVTTRRMMSPEGHTDELTVASRRLRKATEGVEPPVSDAIGTKRRTLNTVETIWAEDVTLTFLEDNIERRGAEAHIAQLLGRQFGNDLNDLAWNGDTAEDSSNGDPFISINDGWIKLMQADADVTDIDASALSTPTQTEILSAMFRALPVQFKGLLDLGYFVPVGFGELYADELSRRETNLGDQVMVNGFPVLRYFGWPVVVEPHLYQENADKAVFSPFSNLHHGIQRQITVDSEWRPRKRAVEFTITARNDYQYATGKAIVLASSIPAANR